MDHNARLCAKNHVFTRRMAFIGATAASSGIAVASWQTSLASDFADPKATGHGIDEPPVDDTTTAIRACLEARSDALSRGDRKAFVATIDQRNPTWRRIQGDVFDLSARGGVPPHFIHRSGFRKSHLDTSRHSWRYPRRGEWRLASAQPGSSRAKVMALSSTLSRPMTSWVCARRQPSEG